MTCRHSPNDPHCSSYRTPQQRILELSREIAEQKKMLKDPDNSQFEILDVYDCQGKGGIVLRVRYDSCESCSYEGVKVLVYLNSSMMDVLKWKVIDPHFSDKQPGPRCAPSPDARFPASEEGWTQARMMLARKNGV